MRRIVELNHFFQIIFSGIAIAAAAGQEAHMADELDPKNQNEELADAAKQDVRDQANDDEEFEDIDEDDTDEDENAADVEE
jgi:hypothetical protein